MGFNPIYLLGFDFSDRYVSESDEPDRLFERHNERDWMEDIDKSLRPVREDIDAHGVRIVNLSRGSQEHVFERGTLADILK